MAPEVWGLNLGQMQWSAFSSKNMFGNRDWHLRRTKFVVYQLALIFCVVSESLGTSALSNYVDEQKFVKSRNSNAYVYNNDYVGAASYNIFAGVFVAFIFGALFFFDLFWPERHESKSVRIAWKVCGVLAALAHLASALVITIITASHQGYVTGVSQEEGDELVSQYGKASATPLNYKKNGRAVAAVVFAWLGWCSIVPSCILLFLSIHNAEKGLGPKSAHAEGRKEAHEYANMPVRERQSHDLEKQRPSEEPGSARQSDENISPSRDIGTGREAADATPAADIPSHEPSTEASPRR
ncbi:hypothetical protein KC351_g5457 [Hortaea werneckii]|nr:hypothetical protein KC351_g5457 [Hortaea werneckii]